MFTIYSKDGCVNCEKSRMALYIKGHQFEVKKLGIDFTIEWYINEFKVRSFPVITTDNAVFKSFEELQNSI